MFIYNNPMDNEDNGLSGDTNSDIIQSAEATVQAASQPDVYDELEEIEVLTNAGVLPHDVDRYLLEGPIPGGLQGADALRLTLEVSKVRNEHPEIPLQSVLEEAKANIAKPEKNIWGDPIDLPAVRVELSQAVTAREKGDEATVRELLAGYISNTFADDVSWELVKPRIEELIYAGLAPEALKLVAAIGSVADAKTISVDMGVQLIESLRSSVEVLNLNVLYGPTAQAAEKLAVSTKDELAVESATYLLQKLNRTMNARDPAAFDQEAERILEQYVRLLPDGSNILYNKLEVLEAKRELGFMDSAELGTELRQMTQELVTSKRAVSDRPEAMLLASDLTRIADVAASGGATEVFETLVQQTIEMMSDFGNVTDTDWYLSIGPHSFEKYLSAGGDVGFALDTSKQIGPELIRQSALEALRLAYTLRDSAFQANELNQVQKADNFIELALNEAALEVGLPMGFSNKEFLSLLIERNEFGFLCRNDLGYRNMDGPELSTLINKSIAFGSPESLTFAVKLVRECYNSARAEVFRDLRESVGHDELARVAKEALGLELASVLEQAEKDKASVGLSTLEGLFDVSLEFLSPEEVERINSRLIVIAQTADFEYCYTKIFDQLGKLNHFESLRMLEFGPRELKAVLLKQDNALELLERLNNYTEESLQNLSYLDTTGGSSGLGTDLALYLLQNGIAPEESSKMIGLLWASHASMSYKSPEETLEEIFTQHLDKANADVLEVIFRNQGAESLMAFMSSPERDAHIRTIRQNLAYSEKLAQHMSLHLIPHYESEYILDVSGGRLRSLVELIELKPELSMVLADNQSPLYAMTSSVLTGIMQSQSPSETADMVLSRVGDVEKLTTYINGLANNPEFIATFTSEILLNPDSSRMEDLLEFVDSNKAFFDLFSDHDSLLYQLRDSIVGEVLLSDNPQAEISAIMDILSGDVPIWVRLYKLAELRYGTTITDNKSILYPVATIPLIRTDLGERPTLAGIEDKELEYIDVSKLTIVEKLRFVVPEVGESIRQYAQIKLQLGREPEPDELPFAILYHIDTLRDGAGIPFSWLQEGYRRNVFGHYLRQSIERSVDGGQKASADLRNRSISSPTLALPSGSFIHGTKGQVLPQVLAIGNFCGEVLEYGHKVDATPLQVDMSILGGEEELIGDKAMEAIQNSVAYGYSTDLYLVFDRSEGAFEEGVVHRDGPWKDKGQVLLPVGVPSTDVRAIVMHQHHSVSLEEVERSIVQNGFYIPIYDHGGNLVFTQEEYDQLEAAALSGVNSERVIAAVEADDFEPLSLINELSLDPELGQLFAKDSGVWEGYSIREHTEAILGQFEKYFADKMASTAVSVPTFRIVLALHDIGKPLSVERTGGTAAQHRFTHEIVSRRGNDLGLEKDEVEIALEVVSHDVMGEFLKGEKTVEETSESILRSATKLGIQPLQLLDLLKIYYLCDASSYTSDAKYTSPDGSVVGCEPSLDFLFTFSNGSIEFSTKNQLMIDDLALKLSQ